MAKHKRLIALFLIFIALLFLFRWEVKFAFTALCKGQLQEAVTNSSSQEQTATLPYKALYQGTQAITIDRDSAVMNFTRPSALDRLSLQEIADFRMKKVAQYSFLNIFPPGYNPLAGASARIYKKIEPGALWVGQTPFYIANPYLLIILSNAYRVLPIDLPCHDLSVTYDSAIIEERLQGATAKCFFDLVYGESAEHPGTLRVNMVNAYDSGFHYVSIDKEQSLNIQAYKSSGNIVGGLFSQPSFYHRGRHGSNNISPEDKNGWITLQEEGAATRIFFKLWRNKPASPENTADMLYIIYIIP